MAVSDYSTTPGSNTSISGLAVSDSTVIDTVDNIVRQMMADIRAADDENAKTADAETITGDWVFSGKFRWSKGTDVASASALAPAGDGNYYDVTGTTTITSIATQGIGTPLILQFDAALTLTHHATDLILPGAANITTAAGDHAVFVEYASGDWRCVSYQRAASAPSGFLDEDDMASDSATDAPSQQSTKAYVDARAITQTSGSNAYFGIRAFATCDGTGTASILRDEGFDSITDLASGIWTLTMTTAMEDTDYCAIACTNAQIPYNADIDQISTTVVRVEVDDTTSTQADAPFSVMLID